MADRMTHMERGLAALSGEEVDRLTCYPIASGICRKLLPGNVTYQQWANDPKLFGQAFIAGQKYFDFDFAIGLMRSEEHTSGWMRRTLPSSTSTSSTM